MEALWYALGTTGFTFFMTALGAAVVFFFRKDVSERFQNLFLGFAAGVMVAASVWSLLIPAMDQAKEAGGVGSDSGSLADSRREGLSFCFWIM